MSLLKPEFIEATTLDDAWHQAVYLLLNKGYRYKIDDGSYKGETRLEFDYVTIHITKPWEEPRLPQIPSHIGIPNPVAQDYVDDYFANYLMRGEKAENEEYTYGERLHISLDTCIDRYRRYGSGNNQLILQVGRPEDIQLPDPPCLRHIDTKVRDNVLHFVVYFRSWDLWGGFPANLAGFQLLKEYMAGEIGCEDGEMIVSSKSLHIYKYVEELAKMRFGK